MRRPHTILKQNAHTAVCIKPFAGVGDGCHTQRYANVLDAVQYELVKDNGIRAILKAVGIGPAEYYFYDDISRPAKPNGKDIMHNSFWEYFKEIP